MMDFVQRYLPDKFYLAPSGTTGTDASEINPTCSTWPNKIDRKTGSDFANVC